MKHRLEGCAHQRGAALLLAMIILTLVVTLAAGMVWQHTRAIQVEAAERARAQSAWILHGALDWARLILAEDARGGANVDHLGEVWAVPLAEARLSTFLAADRTGTVDADAAEDGPDAFLSGSVIDAQSRWNLRNLIKQDNTIDADQREVLDRLCDAAGVPPETSKLIADSYHAARSGSEGANLLPSTMSNLTWLGVDRAVIRQLENFIVLLPITTKLNVNTAPAEVIAAVIPLASPGLGQSLVDARKRDPFKSMPNVLQAGVFTDAQKKVLNNLLDVKSGFFQISGRMRLDDRVLEERSIVRRDPNRSVTVIHRERINHLDALR